ncbi:GntR family transcriptional regulator [Streptomyces sp. HNM0663]|uniref:GntR family transcriptional regulator n=1 Tax=Streptomyces chengmaiensis TaxID=3040919 RepID=A0ABT6HU37_9ACTN|nr:GntR family transcriptional regulator [Streptomyces chengmaiensis]MDH2392234.1 GntR family transcriptional regulator [Streptomyces chengmaiensis]
MPPLKYEQIAESLRRRIADGEFGPGDLLPSSRDLCEQWDVSRATAVKAMDILRADGLIVPHQGRGFSVVQTALARPAGGRRAGTSRTSGGRPFRRLGAPEMLTPPSHVADALGLSAGVGALHRARLVLAEDDTPMTYVTAWFPPDIAAQCPRLAQKGPIAEGTTHYVRRETGRGPVLGVDETTVRLATSAEADHLGVKRPTAVAVDLHTAYDQDDRPLVCEEGVTPSHLWRRTDKYPMGPGT